MQDELHNNRSENTLRPGPTSSNLENSHFAPPIAVNKPTAAWAPNQNEEPRLGPTPTTESEEESNWRASYIRPQPENSEVV